MTHITQSQQITKLQQQQTQQHNIKQLIIWINGQISKKNIPQMNYVAQLASGNIFLEIVSIYYPKKVDLTKTFMNPKDDYEILQNFKQLSSAFGKLGWKKFDPEKFRKRKDKELGLMAQYLRKILSEHLFDNNESTSVHSLLASYPSPDKVQTSKQTYDPIKIEDRKNAKISTQTQSHKHPQSLPPTRKKSENFKTKPVDRIPGSTKQALPPKPPNPMMKTQRIQKQQNSHQKDSTIPKLPPHPHLGTKNILASTTSLKNEQQQLNNFENMRITKLQKQKQLLLKKILQIQQLVVRERNQIVKRNTQTKILSEIQMENEEILSDNKEDVQKENINRVKEAIFSILSDVHL